MAESKHTPGPWRWERASDEWSETEWILISDDKGAENAFLWANAISWDEFHLGGAPDACLIAAAPDLLEMAQAAADLIAEEHGGAAKSLSDPTDWDSAATFWAHQHLRAAIAKAEGSRD